MGKTKKVNGSKKVNGPNEKMNGSNEKWCIGIDLGTTNTYIVAYNSVTGKVYTNESGDFFPGSLTEKLTLKDLDSNIPTRITIEPPKKPLNDSSEKKLWIGEQTKENLSWRVFSDLKTVAREIAPPNGQFGALEKPYEYPFEHCELKSKLEFGHRDCSVTMTVEDLLIEFFKKVLHIDEEGCEFDIKSETIRKIVIGCPANDKVNDEHHEDHAGSKFRYEETLKDILAKCFVKEGDETFKNKIDVNDEPILAGETYLFSEGQSDKNVLVIDIGGGTTDFAIVKYNKNGSPDVIGRGSCEVAGNAIDNYICDLLPKGYAVSMDEIRSAKELCFKEGQGSLNKKWNKNNEDVTIGYVDNEIVVYVGGKPYRGETNGIRKSIKEAIYQPIGAKLSEILMNVTRIDTIFFVGGTSMIEPLRKHLIDVVVEKERFSKDTDTVETLSEADRRNLLVPGGDDLPITCYNAVAIGACIEAIRKATKTNPIEPRRTTNFHWRPITSQAQSESKRLLILKAGEAFVRTAYIAIDKQVLEKIFFSKDYAGGGGLTPVDDNWFQPMIWECGEVVLHKCISAGAEQLSEIFLDKEGKEVKNGLLMVLSLNGFNKSKLDIYSCDHTSIEGYIKSHGLAATIHGYWDKSTKKWVPPLATLCKL